MLILLELVAALAEGGADAIVIVDDGSGDDFGKRNRTRAQSFAGDRGCSVLTQCRRIWASVRLSNLRSRIYYRETHPAGSGDCHRADS